MGWNDRVEFSALLGETLTTIDVNEARDEIRFATESGKRFLMYHSQDCCESVEVEEIVGDPADLIGSPILLAEEVTNENETPEGVKPPDYPDSYTWTFYKLSTIKGSVTIRWLGESNGYYSESVDFERVPA